MFVRRNQSALALVGALLFFGFLWALGFPRPGYDDLFYTGAALNLAGGGDFSNPFLARQLFPSHFFYVYPPLHSYVLAGWLKVFGIHAAAQTGFMIFNCLVICAAMLSILRRREAPAWAGWLVPLGVSFAFLPVGLRPETLAVAMALVGFDLAERGRPGGWIGFTGFLLLMLGASCAPRVMFFALALAACAGFEHWRSAEVSRPRLAALGLVAVGITGLVFFAMIHFRWQEFLHTFRFHAARVNGKPLAILMDYVKHVLGIVQWPLVILPLVMVADALRKPWQRAANVGLFVLAAWVPVVLTGGIGHGSIWWMIVLIFIFAGTFAKNNSIARAAVMGFLIMATLLVVNRKLFANVYGLASGNIVVDAGSQTGSLKAMRPAPEHSLLVDGAVTRYVFDYQLPEGCLDVEFGSPFPGTLPGDISRSELRPGDIYLVGPDTVEVLTKRTYLQQEIASWRAFGISSLTFNKYPRQVYVIHSEDCKDTRARTGDVPIYLPKESRKDADK